MSIDPYSEMTDQDHIDMCEWIDECEQAYWDDGGPEYANFFKDYPRP